MPDMHPLAKELNDIMSRENPALYDLLSVKGKEIFFPKGGILGQTAEAKGKQFNATIGIAVENDGTPMHLPSMDAAIPLDPKEVYPYAPSFGKPELRAKWQEMIREKNPSLNGQISQPVVTNGLTHGLSIAGYLFVDPGEKIIVTDKYWGNYRLTFEHQFGAKLSTFNTFKDGGFDTESLRTKLAEGGKGKKVLLLNFPNNPSGYTPTMEEAAGIVEVIRGSAEEGNSLVVLLDDAYFGLVYKEGVERESLFAKLADLHERVLAVKIDGATKEEYVWGFRVAFLTYASKGITEEMCRVLEEKTAGAIRGNISNAPHLSQSHLFHLFNAANYRREKEEKYELMASRYRKIKEVLSNEKYAEYFTPLPFNSGYFMCVELREGIDAEAVRKKLLSDYDTGVIATGNLLRIAFSSLPEEHIEQVFENIHDACRHCSPSSYSQSPHEFSNIIRKEGARRAPTI